MTKGLSEYGESGGGFHAVHAERDLESNWDVDLAKKLEEYLLKICSGEITGEEEGHVPVNFAEAALLLQGSIQVYSRKVEYLYNLVLRALEFLSQKRHPLTKTKHDNSDGAPVQTDESGSHAVADEENDQFWGLDDIPVEEKNSLDSTTFKEVNLNQFVKPPANLVVLEGDCLDTTGDGGELESYLLATTDLYQDFILLDTSDAASVHEFLKDNKVGTAPNSDHRGSSARKSFHSPTRRSGGAVNKASAANSHHDNFNFSPQLNCSFDVNNVRPSSPASGSFDNCNFGIDVDDGCDAPRDLDISDDDDDDDPWRPLNPHEPGNLRVKPFRKVNTLKRNDGNSSRRVALRIMFPPAKLHGPISPELMEMWEMQHHAFERKRDPQSPPLYEKLRKSLCDAGNESGGSFFNSENYNDDNEYDTGNLDFDVPENDYMDEDVPPFDKKQDDDEAHVKADETIGQEHPSSQASLEDLCRSHLDALLASIAESEKQTEMAARVSTWKQRIEQDLEEQESHPPFDIHDYGERILDKLSAEASISGVLSFTEVVKGQEKYDVARSFSALLQLVNNGDVDVERSVSGGSVCYTDVNPFRVRLFKHNKKRENALLRMSKKRTKSPAKNASTKGDKNKNRTEKSPTLDSSSAGNGQSKLSPPANGKFAVKLRKASAVRCSPEGKRRRRSPFVEPVNLHSAGWR